MERQAVQLKGNVIIIGAGFGGLSCAIRLASQGVQVTILERQDRVGGKLQQIEREGYHFDRGPSTITMPSTFRSVFDHAGVAMEDYVQLYELEPRTRNISANGTVVDLSGNRGWMNCRIRGNGRSRQIATASLCWKDWQSGELPG